MYKKAVEEGLVKRVKATKLNEFKEFNMSDNITKCPFCKKGLRCRTHALMRGKALKTNRMRVNFNQLEYDD